MILGPTHSENKYMYYVFYVKRIMSEVLEFKPFKSGMQWNYVLGGDSNPVSGFCFPLFSIALPRKLPSVWKTVEGTGSKTAASLRTFFW